MILGGFVGSSNLMANQFQNGNIMLQYLSDDQKYLHEKKLKALNDYLKHASKCVKYDSLNDENIVETFMKALNDENPKKIYKVESWRYKFYYNLFKIPFPDTIHKWLIKRFLSFPDCE